MSLNNTQIRLAEQLLNCIAEKKLKEAVALVKEDPLILLYQDSSGWSPLHFVGYFGGVDVVKVALKYQETIPKLKKIQKIKTNKGLSPAMCAVVGGDEKVLKGLLVGFNPLGMREKLKEQLEYRDEIKKEGVLDIILKKGDAVLMSSVMALCDELEYELDYKHLMFLAKQQPHTNLLEVLERKGDLIESTNEREMIQSAIEERPKMKIRRGR